MIEYYGNNDFRDYILAHHGILGMQWGKRNGPPYPIGSGGHSASEKKAGWRKSLGGGRNEHLYDRKSETKSVDKPKKPGLQLTDKQKKALKIGAIAAGVTLAAVGTIYLARTGRLQQIGSAFMGGSSGPNIGDGITKRLANKDPAKVFGKLSDADRKNWTKSVDIVNSYPHGQHQCGPSTAGLLIRHNDGLDVKARLVEESTTWEKMKTLWPGAKEKPIIGCDKISEMSDELAAKFKDGDNGVFGLWATNSSTTQNHFISFRKENGIIIFDDAQAKYSFWIDGNKGYVRLKDVGTKEVPVEYLNQKLSVYNLDLSQHMQVNNHQSTKDVNVLKEFFE